VQATINAAAVPVAAGVTRVSDDTPYFDVRDYVVDAGRKAVAIAGRLLIIGLLTFLLLFTGDFYRRKLAMLAGRKREDRRVTVDVIRTIDHQIERYLIVRILISVIVGTLTGVGLWLVGLANAAVAGVPAGLLNA